MSGNDLLYANILSKYYTTTMPHPSSLHKEEDDAPVSVGLKRAAYSFLAKVPILLPISSLNNDISFVIISFPNDSS